MGEAKTIRLRDISLPDVVHVEVRTTPAAPPAPAVKIYYRLSEAWLNEGDLFAFLQWLDEALNRGQLVEAFENNESGVTFYDPGPIANSPQRI